MTTQIAQKIDYRRFDSEARQLHFLELCELVRAGNIQVGNKFRISGSRQRLGIPLPSGTREIVYDVRPGWNADTLVLPEEGAPELAQSVILEIRYMGGTGEEGSAYPIFLNCHKTGSRDYHQLLTMEGNLE